MYVGILTDPFTDTPLEHLAAFAVEYGFGGLEIITDPSSKHISTDTFCEKEVEDLLALMEKRFFASTMRSKTRTPLGRRQDHDCCPVAGRV
jgi:sugar phosphate isomerase/epimerase